MPKPLTASEEAERRGRVGSFLLTSLRTAAGRYQAAADSFNNEILATRGVDFALLDEEDADYTLADRAVARCESAVQPGVCSQCRIGGFTGNTVSQAELPNSVKTPGDLASALPSS